MTIQFEFWMITRLSLERKLKFREKKMRKKNIFLKILSKFKDIEKIILFSLVSKKKFGPIFLFELNFFHFFLRLALSHYIRGWLPQYSAYTEKKNPWIIGY